MARSRPKQEDVKPEGVPADPAEESRVPAEELPPLVPRSPVTAPVRDFGATPESEARQDRYRVEVDRKVMHRGAMVLLRSGKVIRAADYNVDDLLVQGCRLQKLP